CLFHSYTFLFPVMYNLFTFFFKFIFNQGFIIVLGKIIKIIFFIDIDEYSIIFNKGSKTPFTFGNFFTLIPCNWCISFFLKFNELHSTIISYVKNIFSRR